MQPVVPLETRETILLSRADLHSSPSLGQRVSSLRCTGEGGKLLLNPGRVAPSHGGLRVPKPHHGAVPRVTPQTGRQASSCLGAPPPSRARFPPQRAKPIGQRPERCCGRHPPPRSRDDSN